jgi:hypothetical protein
MLANLDYVHFNGGDNPTNWICQIEQLLKFRYISYEEKIPLVSYHFGGEAYLWYFSILKSVKISFKMVKRERS